MILPPSFYSHHTVEVARQLLGKILMVAHLQGDSQIPCMMSGRIVEVEAYRADDPAAHSFKGITPRCSVMFADPGHAYVFTMHRQRMLNFVTEPPGHPGAVLIRALEPLTGIKNMQKLRPQKKLINLTNGPGKLCQALGIQISDYGASLQGPRIFVLDDHFKPQKIIASSRIGISKGQDLPWRFYLAGNSYVSKLSTRTN